LGDITPEIVEVIVQRLKEFHRPFNISLTGFGEPLLFSGLFDFISKIRPLVRGRITLTTNGILLDDRVAPLVLESGIDEVDISVNIPTRELHGKYHHDETYDLVRNNAISFLKSKIGGKLKVMIRMMKFRDTLPHLSQERDFWSKHLGERDFYFETLLMNWAGHIDEKHYGVEYGDPIQPVCRHLLDNALAISKDGDVFACCVGSVFPPNHPSCLGNLDNYSLEDMLKIKRTNSLKFYPECSVCSEYRHYIDPVTGEHMKRMVKVKDYV